MIEPTETLLISWVYHLRDDATDTLHATDAGADSADAAALHTSASATPLAGRSLKWATILKHKRQISGTLIELRGAKLSHCPRLETLITSFEEDGESKAPAFLPDEVFEDLWDALWGLPIGYTKQVALWSRFLLQFGTIGRSSDVTGKYCPLYADCSYPTSPEDWLEDGTPAWIDLTRTDWKSRPKNHKKAPYHIRIYHNPKNLRFCPVTWLLQHWSLRSEAELDTVGAAIFQKSTKTQYSSALKVLFTAIGKSHYSTHSIRRSAARVECLR